MKPHRPARTALRRHPRTPHASLPYALRLTPYALILALLTGCLFDRTPATPRPPTPTLTPRPTPTETAAILPIRQPTAPPTSGPRVTATPPGDETLDVRANGQIIYIANQGGRRDIMAVEGNGSGRRRIVSGTYEAPVWSPDGSRFAVYGATVSGGRPNQLAIFDEEGRALARYALEGVGVGQPSWSPDGRSIFCQQRDPAETSGARTAWIADESGLRQLPLPEGAMPWRWMPNNRYAYLIYPAGGQRQVSQTSPLAVWSADPASGQSQKEIEGVFAPLGWSPSGQTFYAFDGLLPAQSGTGTRATTLIAIDGRTGSTRTLSTADRLVAPGEEGTPGTPGGVARGGARWFEGGSVAPVAGQLVVWVRSATANGPVLVVVLDETGRTLVRDSLPPGDTPVGFTWSAGGQIVAFVATGNGNTLHILAAGGRAPVAYPLATTWFVGSALPSWSPDSRWLALIGPDNTLVIAAAIGTPRLVSLSPDGGVISPAWRPAMLR